MPKVTFSNCLFCTANSPKLKDLIHKIIKQGNAANHI